MRMPESLETLAEYGLVDEVLRPLMSGKEAQIFLVLSQGQERVAKVYREAEHRDFKHRAAYTEGRNVRNTRDKRAMAKRSRYGRAQDEAAWRATEVDMIYRLSDAGVRVPKPYHFIDGVLIMELVTGPDGEPAPRLGDLDLGADAAARVYEQLLREVIRMLAAGVVHGDLSDFNVLMDAEGPVVIDFPQAVDASANSGARQLLMRDVENLHRFLRRSIPGVRLRPYAQEMWDLYQRGELTPDTELRGHFKADRRKVNTDDVLGLIREADEDERRRRGESNGGHAGGAFVRPRRVEVMMTPPAKPRDRKGGRQQRGGGGRPDRAGPRAQHGAQGEVEGVPAKRRRRRKRPHTDGGERSDAERAAVPPPTRQQHRRAETGNEPPQERPAKPRRKRRAKRDGTGAAATGPVPSQDRSGARQPVAHATDGSSATPARRRRRRRSRGAGNGHPDDGAGERTGASKQVDEPRPSERPTKPSPSRPERQDIDRPTSQPSADARNGATDGRARRRGRRSRRPTPKS